MRDHFDVDQIQNVIDELKQEKYSRRATISLLDPRIDAKSKSPPCLNHCWFRIQSNKLYLIATIRSNDMFEAWPENAFGLRMLQDLIWKELLETYPEMELGDLVIHSLSAHAYDDSWEDAKQIVKKYYNQVVPHPRSVRDPRGNFIIRVEDGEIIVEHYSPNEVLLNVYKNKKAMPIYFELSRNEAISLISHALYIGAELQKAEMAIKLDTEYEQDKK
jgi:thymidylate synthase